VKNLKGCISLAVVFAFAVLNGTAQIVRGGTPTGAGVLMTGTDIHHDRSKALRSTTPIRPLKPIVLAKDLPKATLAAMEAKGIIRQRKEDPAGATAELATPFLVNGGTGVATNIVMNEAGLGLYFSGPGGAFNPAVANSEATGAVGTTQYLQWVDNAFAVFNKVTGVAEYGPAAGNTIWTGFGGPCETQDNGQFTVNFDKLSSRWVVSKEADTNGAAPFLQCVAVSTSSDATGTWYRYSFQLAQLIDNQYQPKNAKLGTWSDGYYMAFDMYSGATFVGDKLCALQRANMVNGAGAGFQCILLNSEQVGYTAADVDGNTPPPAGLPEYFIAADSSYVVEDVEKFHVDWADSQNSTLGLEFQIDVGLGWNPTCSIYSFVGNCIPQLGTTQTLDANPERPMGRIAYRNYGDHQAFFATETDATVASPASGPAAPTAPRFYEFRLNGNNDLYLYQDGYVAPDQATFRFGPSIASDRAGNIAIAYNASSASMYPSQFVSTRAAGDPLGTMGNETYLNPGNASQTSGSTWDYRSELTVDPVDDCTYWYTEQYIPFAGSTQWVTVIAGFTLQGCAAQTVTLQTVPAGLMVELGGGKPGVAPVSGQFLPGSQLAIAAINPQPVSAGVQYAFSNWSDGGAASHNITVPGTATTYTASFTTQYQLTTAVSPAAGGTVSIASGTFLNAGTPVSITAIPAPGYEFFGWKGNVAKTNSASTTVTLTAPTTVSAVFLLIPKVTAKLTSESGPSNARVWTYTFTNTGTNIATGLSILNLRLVRTAGTVCTPVVTSTLPMLLPSLAVSGTETGSITVNFSTCDATSRFAAAMTFVETGSAQSSVAGSNLAQ